MCVMADLTIETSLGAVDGEGIAAPATEDGGDERQVQGIDVMHSQAVRRLSFESWLEQSRITLGESSSQGFCTPKKRPYVPTMCASFIPICVDRRKPVIGMSFHSCNDAEEFYKSYAHDGGFSVRVGSQNKALGEVINKRYMCSRAGFKKVKEVDDPPKNQKNHALTRCGCDANMYVKLGPDKKYHITSMVEEHNHPLCSPNKIPFLRSNRVVSQRAKNTLFTCHKASIGTSQAFRILQVSDGGFAPLYQLQDICTSISASGT